MVVSDCAGEGDRAELTSVLALELGLDVADGADP